MNELDDDDEYEIGRDLEEVKGMAQMILKRVEELHNNITAADQGQDWQQQYNEQVLQQRVREELEKKQRFEELEKREAARELKARRLELAEEVDAIQAEYRKQRVSKMSGPKCMYRSFIPFGKALFWSWQPAIDSVLCVGSNGFLGVWQYGSVPPETLSPCFVDEREKVRPLGEPGWWAPTLVDYTEAVREMSPDDPHAVVTSCLCMDLDGYVPKGILDEYETDKTERLKAEESDPESFSATIRKMSSKRYSINDKITEMHDSVWVLLFSATKTGRGSLMLAKIRKQPHIRTTGMLSEKDMLEYRELKKLYESNPSAAVQKQRIDLDNEGFRWIEESAIVMERPISGPGVTTCAFLPMSNTVVTAVQGAIKCYDLHLKNLWTCQLNVIQDTISSNKTVKVMSRKPSMRKMSELSRGTSQSIGTGTQNALQHSDSVTGASFSMSRGQPLQSPLQQQQQQQQEKRTISAIMKLDDTGSDFIIGMSNGDIFLLLVPRESALEFAQAIVQRDADVNNTFATYSDTCRRWLSHIEDRKSRRHKNKLNRDANTGSSYSGQSYEEDSLLDADPAVDEIFSSQSGVRLVLLASVGVGVTCFRPTNGNAIAFGCEDGQVGSIQPDLNKGLFIFADEEQAGGPNCSVRDIEVLQEMSKVISLDCRGVIRLFQNGKCTSFTRTAEIDPQKLRLGSLPNAKGFSTTCALLHQDAFSVWCIP